MIFSAVFIDVHCTPCHSVMWGVMHLDRGEGGIIVRNAFVMFLLVFPLYIVYNFACLLQTVLLLRYPRLLRTATPVLDRLHCMNHVFDAPTNHPDDHLLLQGRNSLAQEQINAKLTPLATSLGAMTSDSYMDVLAYAACI
jgi:hypothetical protein